MLVPVETTVIVRGERQKRIVYMRKSLTWSGHKLQGRTTFQGLSISIENRAGTYRRGTDPDGHEWKTKLHNDYGYIRGSVGVDGDHVDCFLGPDRDSRNAYIIHQVKPGTQTYDEDKVMLGFPGATEAKKAYLSNYDRSDVFGSMETVTIDQLKSLIERRKGRKLVKGGNDMLFFDGLLIKARRLGSGKYHRVKTTVHRNGKTFQAYVWRKIDDDDQVDQMDLFSEAAIDQKMKKKEFSIREHLKKFPIKTFSGTVVKKGRKWLKVIPEGKTYEVEVEINNKTDTLSVGDVFNGISAIDVQRSKYGVKTQVYPLLDEEIPYGEKKESERWLSYVEEAAREGRLYEKGIKKLREMDMSRFPDLVKRLEEIVKEVTIPELDRWVGFVESAAAEGRLYEKGVWKLIKLGVDRSPDHQRRMDQALKKVKKAEAEKQKVRSMRVLYPLSMIPQLNVPTKRGEKLIVFTGVGKSFRIDESYPSRGGSHLLGHEGEKGAYVYYREATEGERESYEQRQQKEETKRRELSSIRQSIGDVRDQIQNDGDMPAGPVVIDGKRYMDTANAYGGGEWFEITDDAIWYVQNNGSDGDDWGRNNVRTGGAGAIGWMIPYNENIAKKIRDLDEKLLHLQDA